MGSRPRCSARARFFADLLERKSLRRVSAAKRGGKRPPISLDAEAGEARYLDELRDDWTPEREFERNWALALLGRVSERLQEQLESAGKGPEYHALAGYLTDDGDKRPYREVAAELGSTEAAVKMAVRRLRQRFGALLREEIAHTLQEGSDVDRELRSLLGALREG